MNLNQRPVNNNKSDEFIKFETIERCARLLIKLLMPTTDETP